MAAGGGAGPSSPTVAGCAAAEVSLEGESEGSDAGSAPRDRSSSSPPLQVLVHTRPHRAGGSRAELPGAMGAPGGPGGTGGPGGCAWAPPAHGAGDAPLAAVFALPPPPLPAASPRRSAARLSPPAPAGCCSAARALEILAAAAARAPGAAGGGGPPLQLHLPLRDSRSLCLADALRQLRDVVRGTPVGVVRRGAGELPREVLAHIVGFLPVAEVRACGRVSLEWRAVTTTPEVWQALCWADYPLMTEELQSGCEPWDPAQVDGVNGGPGRCAVPARHLRRLGWRRQYNRKAARERVWIRRAAPPNAGFSDTVLLAQSNGIHCIQFDDQELLTGSGSGNEIGVWDMQMLQTHGPTPPPQCQRSSLQGHASAVTCLEFDAERVLSGGLDHTVRLWDRAESACVKVLTGHGDKVWCLQLAGDRAVSGSSDKSVRVWDVATGDCLGSLRDHRTSVSCVRMRDNIVVSGSAGNSIRIWDINTGQCMYKLRGHQKGVFCLQFDHSKLISGSLDSTLRVWDPRASFRCVRELKVAPTDTPGPGERERGIICFAYDDTKLVSGGADNLVKVWDIRQWDLLHALTGHRHWITSLQFDGSKIVTGSRDKTVRQWTVRNLCRAPQLPR
eukprot:TRINITY_DN48203_c0_g1_i1.p1 TRINITY_DN48203_c0_g1~~TRINITY_DN48203_c0_g1_i1.p1  ORF type:complete len:650 (+),score=175.77 TRINITY_DN48203_c0_g1_i1:98-1951(+)